MMTDSNQKPNRLIFEKSPYLLQHARNPVDWFPWGQEAFAKAKAEDKPVFLSIGYSTCHWCHVMERETFEDERAARALNEGFVSIKVDREERPDIDHIYMDVCQAMTGSGGWPLSVFMDAEGRPFFTGTYFTNARFLSLLQKIRDLWTEDRAGLASASASVQHFLDARENRGGKGAEELPGRVYAALAAGFDTEFGGFSAAPKFPSPHLLLFLMRYAGLQGEPHALKMALKTLDAMDRGGVHDHIGGGFCRYSTDRRWLAPHFEKMLYDNALLAYTYAQAFCETGEKRFGETARETLAYMSRVLQSPEGGFYTAEDADAEGEEGRFYLWTRQEVKEILGERADAFCIQYGITEEGNFEKKNILSLIQSRPSFSGIPDFSKERAALFAAREQRPHPFLDDKVLACWNGLSMAAFAFAGQVLGEAALVETAEQIWRFLFQNMMDARGILFSSWREGVAKNPGHADDYAYVIWGLLELFAATGKPVYLSKAVLLSGILADLFTDEKSGALFFSGSNAEKLIAKTRTGYDGAVPSANSVQAENLIWMYALMGDSNFADRAEKIIAAFAGDAAGNPAAFAYMMRAFLRKGKDEPRVVVTAENKTDMADMVLSAQKSGALTVPLVAGEELPENLKEYFSAFAFQKGKSVAYVCRGYTCLPPVTNESALLQQLKKE
jgi:uncharacterized protein YyaL (SSP411 family)